MEHYDGSIRLTSHLSKLSRFTRSYSLWQTLWYLWPLCFDLKSLGVLLQLMYNNLYCLCKVNASQDAILDRPKVPFEPLRTQEGNYLLFQSIS